MKRVAVILALALAISGCASAPTTPDQINLKIDGTWHEVTEGSVIEFRDAKTGRFHPLKITPPAEQPTLASRRQP